uniref:CLN6 transmembrane ER protein a n=1 Tax=Biomphalaria glabrata TaxID=6526 RepID=A0A2C9KTF0_BIOGL
MVKNDSSGLRQRQTQSVGQKSGATTEKETKEKSRKPKDGSQPFHYDLWLILALDNWIFDFGRPIAAMFVPLTWTPLDMPSIGDYFHMAYNVITPFCLLKVIVLSAAIALWCTSLPLSIRGIQQNLAPSTFQLLKSFELLYRYDEEIGHLMWYIPFFLCLLLYYVGCFTKSSTLSTRVGFAWSTLVLVSGTYYWYLATEGQIFPLFFITYLAMVAVSVLNSFRGLSCDLNGRFLIWTFTLTTVLTGVWSFWLWDDQTLRKKYPGLIYIPEPWAYYTLYLAQ